ncbi:hypothetical protein [Mucilaginibacter lacusdianchii]|uniref:hypothetical protein n=1 Tax=Mucilaginibacter lacusdianchii TaxID=2684211 RepID=UPI00131CFBC5|nr:hypothetical protein [Mucilaginibacter sp. JXJ CY 39]
MAAAFTQIKAFISTYTGYNFDEISRQEMEDLKNFVQQSFQAIRWEILTDLETLPDESSKKQYISNLQVQLVYLNSIHQGYNHEMIVHQRTADFAGWLTTEIFQLLEHIRAHFSAYFDDGQNLPDNYIKAYRNQHPEIWADFEQFLKEHPLDSELKLLLTQFANATESSEKFVIKTWRQFDYLLNMIWSIIKWKELTEEENRELALLKLFVYNEFNSIQIYAYFIKYIEKITLGEASYQDQQQELLYLLKVFRQVRVDAYLPYDPKVQSLKLSVVESLETELAYLEQMEKLQVQHFQGTNPEAPSRFYFNVAVTLAELMFFFRVMLEVKVIYTKFNSYLYEFISNHIRTERTDNISKKSMRNHFSNKPFPDRVVQNVKAWLEKMIQHINLHYHI